MSAVSVIELDTEAPALALLTAVRVGDEVMVPYTLDDDAEILTVMVSTLEGQIAVQVFPDHFEFTVPPNAAQQTAHLQVTAIDDVLNPVSRQVGIDLAGSSAIVSGRVSKNPQVLFDVAPNPRVSGRVTKNPEVKVEIHGN